MTAFFTDKIEDITISAGATASRIVTRAEYQDARIITIISPSDIDGKTYTIMVTSDVNPTSSSTWATLKDSAGASVAVPAVSCAMAYELLAAFTGFYLKPSGAVTPAVTFKATKQWIAG